MSDPFAPAVKSRYQREFKSAGKFNPKSSSDREREGFRRTIAAAPVTLPYAAVNTVGGSIENITKNTLGRGIKFFDTDVFNEKKERSRLQSVADMTGLGYAEMVADNYEANQAGLKTTADVALLFTGVGAVSKGTRGVGALGKLGTTNTGRKLFGDYTRVDKAYDDYHLAAKTIANEELGVITSALGSSRNLDDAHKAIRSSLFNVNPRKGPLGAAVKEAAATEVLIAATMNDSEFFFPEGMNNWDYAQMAAFGFGLPVGIEKLQQVARIKGLNKATGEQAVRKRRGEIGQVPSAVSDDEVLMLAGVQNNAVKGALDSSEVSKDLKRNAGLLQDTTNSVAGKAVGRLAAVDDQFGANKAFLTNDEIDNVVKSVNENPNQFLGVTSIDAFNKTQPEDISFKLREIGIGEVEKGLDALKAKDKKTATDKLNIEVKSRKLEELRNTHAIGLAQDGTTFTRKLADGFDGNVAGAKLNKVTGKFGFKKGNSTPKGEHMEITSAYAKMGGKELDSFTDRFKTISNVAKYLEDAASDGRSYVDDDFAALVLDKVVAKFGERHINNAIAQSKRLTENFKVQDLSDYKGRIQSRSFKKKVVKLSKGGFDDFTYLDMSRHFNLPLHKFEAENPSNLGLYLDNEANLRKAAALGPEGLRDDYKTFIDNARNLDGEVPRAGDEGLKLSAGLETIAGKPVVLKRDLRKQEINVREHRDLALVAQAHQDEVVNKLASMSELVEQELRELNAPNLGAIVLANTNDEFARAFSEAVPNIFAGSERATAGNATVVGDLAANVLPQDKGFRNAYVEAFEFATQINKSIRNQYETAAKNYLKEREDVIAAIRKKDNFADLTSMNIAMRSFQQGWDFVKNAKFTDEGFRISDTVANREKLSNFGLDAKSIDDVFKAGDAAVPDITRLSEGVYQPVGLTKLAGETLEFLREADDVARINRNAIRAATGKQVVPDEGLNLPNAQLDYEQTVVLHELGSNKIIDVVTKKDVDDAMTSAQVKADALNGKVGRSGNLVVAKPAVQFKAETGQTALSQGFDLTKNNGALVPGNPNALLDTMLKSIIKDWGSVSADAVKARFTKEVNFLQHMAENLKSADGNVRASKTRNVYREVHDQLLGINTARPSGNAYNKFMNGVDELGDVVFQKTAKVLDPLLGNLKGGEKKVSKALDDIAKSTGYKPAQEFIEANGINTSVRTEDVVRRMNAVTGFWVLRFAELGQSLLNIATIPTILPTVGKTMSRRKGESFDEYRARVGGFATIVGDGGTPTRMDTMKVMQDGIHGMFTDEGRKIYQEAKALGNLNANVIETHDIIFEGGKQLSNPSVWTKMKNAMTTPTDFTEQYSRSVSYMAGYRLFQREAGKELDKDTLHKLANWFADRNVGDYSKINRPDVFRGGVGSALGLFQTFFTNYWQRLASALEKGDGKTLLTQGGTQFAMFGMESIPGYDLFEKAWTSYDGTQTPWESLVGSYGVDYAELLNTGSLSNITRLFGGEGIALHTRGDTNVRGIPNVTNVAQVPAVTLMKKLQRGVVQAGSLVKQEGAGTSGRRLLEIAANASPSRSIRGALEVINGRAVDNNGGLVTSKTREWESIAARLIGSKPLAEQRAGAMMYRQRGIQQIANARVSIMRNNFAAKIRDDGMSKKLVNEMLERYIEEHRNPATFKQWLKELNKKAVKSKSHRELLRTYKAMAKGQTSKYADKKTLKFYQLIASDPESATEFYR